MWLFVIFVFSAWKKYLEREKNCIWIAFDKLICILYILHKIIDRSNQSITFDSSLYDFWFTYTTLFCYLTVFYPLSSKISAKVPLSKFCRKCQNNALQAKPRRYHPVPQSRPGPDWCAWGHSVACRRSATAAAAAAAVIWMTSCDAMPASAPQILIELH